MKLGYPLLFTALGVSILVHAVAAVLFVNFSKIAIYHDPPEISLTILRNSTSRNQPGEFTVVGHPAPTAPPVINPGNPVTSPTAIMEHAINLPNSPTRLDRLNIPTQERVLEAARTLPTIGLQPIEPTVVSTLARVPGIIETENLSGIRAQEAPKLILTPKSETFSRGNLLSPLPSLQYKALQKNGSSAHTPPPRIMSGEILIRILDRNENTAKYQSAALINLPPTYPKKARQEGLEGRVILSVLIAQTGFVKEISILETSGVLILDKAAISAVTKWRFIPAKVKNSNVESTLLVPIRFRLEN